MLMLENSDILTPGKLLELLRGGSYKDILMIRDKLILFSVKREFRKLFFVTRDMKVSRDS